MFIVQATAWMKKGLFEHKSALAFISLTFIHAKGMKFKPTFARPFNKFWQYFTKVFYNKNFQFSTNFILFCLIKIFCSARISQILITPTSPLGNPALCRPLFSSASLLAMAAWAWPPASPCAASPLFSGAPSVRQRTGASPSG